jgi:hypothetical protein
MKAIKTLAASKKVFKTFALWMLLYIPLNSFAQTDSAKKAEPVAAEAPSLISPSVSFLTVQKSDNTIDLKAALKAKINGGSKNLELLKISYVLVTDSIEKPLGFVITDRNGKAVLNIKADSLKADKEGKLHFKAVFAGNKAMETAEGEVSIKRARLEITPVKGDSTFSVSVKLVDLGTGAETPIPETALGVFVSRLFFPLKVGEGTTDATGVVSVDIPKNLPGDTKGNITLLAKIDENELYGNLEASITQPWGARVSDQLKELPRSLWSPHPPIWMLATFIILMVAVWGHYIVIVVQLFRLRKEEPQLPVGTA